MLNLVGSRRVLFLMCIPVWAFKKERKKRNNVCCVIRNNAVVRGKCNWVYSTLPSNHWSVNSLNWLTIFFCKNSVWIQFFCMGESSDMHDLSIHVSEMCILSSKSYMFGQMTKFWLFSSYLKSFILSKMFCFSASVRNYCIIFKDNQ